MANEVLNHIMTVLPQFTDLLCVDVELQDVAMEILQVFSWPLEAKSSIMVGETISNLLNCCWIRQEVC